MDDFIEEKEILKKITKFVFSFLFFCFVFIFIHFLFFLLRNYKPNHIQKKNIHHEVFNKIDQENQIVSKDEELYIEEEEKTGA